MGRPSVALEPRRGGGPLQTLRVGIIGCGARGAGRTGAARAHEHWRGYASTGRCRLAALADIRRENAEAFAAEHVAGQDPEPAIYEDYRAMLAEQRPDVVSICTWTALHPEMVAAAVASGVRAIHCEKPLAPTWGEARRMVAVAAAAGVPLCFTHQRRFEWPFRAARRLLRAGAVGRLLRSEGYCANLFDWGTHWFDMMHFYNDEQPARWVMGQVDLEGASRVFGTLVEGQGLAVIAFANGVQGLLQTGRDRPFSEANRLIGTDGVIEVQMDAEGGGRIPLRLRGRGDADWQTVEPEPQDQPGRHGPVAAATADLLHCLDHGGEPELSAARGLRATELIFATYESSRRRGRVDLPLAIDDSPLAAMAADRGLSV